MYSVLGYLSLAMLVILALPYPLRILNKKMLDNNPKITSLVKQLKKIHRPVGAAVGVLAIVHGYMAMGSLRLHTGTLTYLSMLIAVCFGGLFHIKKKKTFLTLHRSFAVITLGLLAVHLLFPSAIYYLMN